MRILGTALLLLASAATSECSVDSSVPLGVPSAESFDRRLLGEWTCADEDDPDDAGTASVYAFNESEYLILLDREKDPIHIRGFATHLDGSRFLNIQYLSFEPTSSYTIVGYKFESSTSMTLRIVELGSRATKPRTQASLSSYVRRREAEDSLYDDDPIVCERPTPKTP